MTDAEKLSQVKSLMNITDTDFDAHAVFLSFAQSRYIELAIFGQNAGRRDGCASAV